MPAQDAYLQEIRKRWPDQSVREARRSAEGAANDVLIVDEAWVFRFPKNDAAREDLERETRVLQLLPKHVDLAVPETDLRDGVMRQRKLPGRPLDRHTLLRQPRPVQERLMEEMAHFLFQLHRVPRSVLDEAGVGQTRATVGQADAEDLYEEVEREVMPHLKPYAKAVVREHFRPVLSGELSLAYEPVLIHADLNPSHLLWDAERGRLCGVIDFGMAGLGDSAVDYAFVILTLGETPLRRMHVHHPGIGEKIDRARFWALAMEMQYVLSALRTREPRWLVGHIGSARDLLPIGTPWA